MIIVSLSGSGLYLKQQKPGVKVIIADPPVSTEVTFSGLVIVLHWFTSGFKIMILRNICYRVVSCINILKMGNWKELAMIR